MLTMHEDPGEAFATFSPFGFIDLGIFHDHMGELDGHLYLAIIFSGFQVPCAYCLQDGSPSPQPRTA
jgi:hypothetical protein